MIKLASESVDTVEERHSLPSGVQEESRGPSGFPIPIQRHVYVSTSIGALCEWAGSPQLLDVERKSKGSTGIRSHRDLV